MNDSFILLFLGSKALLTHIFMPFSRLEGTGTNHAGTGQ